MQAGSTNPIPSARLRELGIELPRASSPLGAYVEAAQEGNLLFLSGILPLVHGRLPLTGRFGESLTIAQGQELVKLAALNGLAVASQRLQGLDWIKGLVRLGVFMMTTPDFVEHVPIADAASELFATIFGKIPGHTRLISGVQSLPIGAPLVLELIFQLQNNNAASVCELTSSHS
jgi:enamine deaminase RidA (YjgF/YER057c/UK114 family)